MSPTGSTLRWTATSLVLSVVLVVTLLVIGDAYSGTDTTLGVTIDGEPGAEQLIGPQSGTDVRNASVVLALLGLGVAVATYFYWSHTGHSARRRFRAERLASAAASNEGADATGSRRAGANGSATGAAGSEVDPGGGPGAGDGSVVAGQV